jgi:hypothetical protein
MTQTGFLAGPIAGLRYETPTHQGLTGAEGEFLYEEGERVAFLVGATPIGNVSARPRVNLAQIVARVDGDVAKLRDPGLTNVARFVFTLGRKNIRDHGTQIAPEVHDIIGRRHIDFRHDADFTGTAAAGPSGAPRHLDPAGRTGERANGRTRGRTHRLPGSA